MDPSEKNIQIVLKKGREKSVLRHHPWIFSGAIASVQGIPGDGDTVEVCSAEGEFLAYGAYSHLSQIQARIWSWSPKEKIGADFFRARITAAIATRNTLGIADCTNAFRLVHAESDGLPGLIVDKYADWLVIQSLSCGVEKWCSEIATILVEITGIKQIYERSDVEVRTLEGLPERNRLMIGDQAPSLVLIQEQERKYLVDIQKGHKTGFYLDQRENRQRVSKLAYGRDVLDCFCYTGGFTVAVLAGGAKSVTAVDASAKMIQLARENLALNGFTADRAEWVVGDVFRVLRELRDRRRSFDLIILDPPKFAPTVSLVSRAARGYKDINLLAFKLLRPGGFLVTFSCSGGLSVELFEKIVADAALDAGVEGRIVEKLFQGADHPVALNFPEGAYLKGLVINVYKGG